MQLVKTLVLKRKEKRKPIGTILLRNRYDLLFFFYYGVQNSPHLATLSQNQNKLLFKTLSFDEFLKSYTKICQITMGKHKRERSRSREKKKKKKRNRSSSPESKINKKSLKKIKKKSKKSKDSLPSIDDIISNKLKEKQLAGKGEPSVRF